ncbi:MAG: diguanylate cyclase [Spirochaetes bacterium]|nr:diguanylate cyclase [Spirochaetota bacterium]
MSLGKILIVEDDPIVARLLAQPLQDVGYSIVGIATNCHDATQLACTIKPDIAIVDIVLYDHTCDGIELESELRGKLQIPVLFITGATDKNIRDRLKNSHCYGFLSKPINEHELIINVEAALKRHQLEKALRASEEKFRLIYEASPIGIEVYDKNGLLLDANQACLDIFGVDSVEHVRGFKLFEDPNVSHEHKEKLKNGETVRYEAPFDFGLVRSHALYSTSKTGIIYLDVLITPLRNGQEENYGYLVQVQDITARKIYENTLRELSMVDQLTGLYNRRGFSKLADQQIQLAKRNGENLVLFFIDINNMKKINDQFGHPEGDKALIFAANVLRKTFRKTDIICRWGGDEFAVLMINAKGSCEEKIGTRLTEAIKEINAQSLLKTELSLSWGCASLSSQDNADIETLIARADKAMYYHKFHQK